MDSILRERTQDVLLLGTSTLLLYGAGWRHDIELSCFRESFMALNAFPCTPTPAWSSEIPVVMRSGKAEPFHHWALLATRWDVMERVNGVQIGRAHV